MHMRVLLLICAAASAAGPWRPALRSSPRGCAGSRRADQKPNGQPVPVLYSMQTNSISIQASYYTSPVLPSAQMHVLHSLQGCKGKSAAASSGSTASGRGKVVQKEAASARTQQSLTPASRERTCSSG